MAEFATPTERALATLLDALGIRWEYEPTEFPLEYKPDGKVKSAFRPDFYLPDLDLYVEVTLQKTLTGKNKKLRLLAERHPEVRVVLLSRKELALFTEAP